MKNGDYVLVIAPEEYVGMLYRGRYVYEHHLVWWENTGDLVGDGEVVHHINDDKRDNRFVNLQRMTVAEHNKLHGSGITMCELLCPECGKIFFRERRRTFLAQKSEISFCSRKCIGYFAFSSASRDKIKEAKKINLIQIFVE